MRKSVLITRPIDQSAEIAMYLEGNNFEVFVEPIFSVETLPISEIELENLKNQNIAAIVITSQNAVKTAIETVEKLNLDKDIRIFAVGKKTAEKFLSEGYKNVLFSTENSATNLKNIILQDHKNEKDLLLYFCGEIISLDLKGELAKLDIKLEKIISYRIIEKTSFSDEFLQRTKNSRIANIDFILVYSKNSARILLQLINKHALFEFWRDSKILCFSKDIQSFVKSLGFSNVATFDEIKILEKFYE